MGTTPELRLHLGVANPSIDAQQARCAATPRVRDEGLDEPVDLPSTCAFCPYEPSQVNVARSRETKRGGDLPDATTRLRHRQPVVVQLTHCRKNQWVIAGSGARHTAVESDKERSSGGV